MHALKIIKYKAYSRLYSSTSQEGVHGDNRSDALQCASWSSSSPSRQAIFHRYDGSWCIQNSSRKFRAQPRICLQEWTHTVGWQAQRRNELTSSKIYLWRRGVSLWCVLDTVRSGCPKYKFATYRLHHFDAARKFGQKDCEFWPIRSTEIFFPVCTAENGL